MTSGKSLSGFYGNGIATAACRRIGPSATGCTTTVKDAQTAPDRYCQSVTPSHSRGLTLNISPYAVGQDFTAEGAENAEICQEIHSALSAFSAVKWPFA